MRADWILILPFLGGCSVRGPVASVDVVLPALPAPWTDRFARREAVVIAYDDGCPVMAYEGPWTQQVPLQIAGGSPIPVLVVPICDTFPLRPAGALIVGYPEGASVRATWHDGVVATIASVLGTRGVDLRGFNWLRLATEIRKRGPPDPWDLDLDRIAVRIVEGSFRVTDLRVREKVTVEIDLDPGLWFTDSALGPMVDSPAFELAPGYHRLFHASSPRQLSLMVGEEETVVLER
jgi:hypothetical protein